MKTKLSILAVHLAAATGAMAQSSSYKNTIIQHQLPNGVDYVVTVDPTGSQQSPLAINPGGARFDLYTQLIASPTTSYPALDSKYVGAYIPIAQLAIRSEDPYSTIPRTRADRPFYVDITVSGLLSGATDPVASQGVTFTRYKQSYGATGTGVGVIHTQGTAVGNPYPIGANGTQTLTYLMTSLTATPQTKVRGEEYFEITSLKDDRGTYVVDPSQLAAQFIQIWPVADGSIAGITTNQLIRFALPTVTLTLNDLYPSSTTYAQVYQGAAVLGKTGTVVPGSSLVVNETIPQSRVLTLTNWDKVFDADGKWTLELVTSTPFGVERLAYVTFNLDRTIQVNGNVNTIE